MKRSVFLMAAVAVAVAGCGPSGGSGLQYESDWNLAVSRAKQEKKPILLNFGGLW